MVGTAERGRAAERPPLGDDTLVFMHLPKTGGTALRSGLREMYEPDAVAFIYAARDLQEAMTQGEFEKLPASRMDALRLVMGHFRYGIHARIGRPCRYVTLVRDPIDRVASLYYHYLTLPGVRFASAGHRERWRLRLRRISLEDWVFREAHIAADNLMVRNIAGSGSVPFGRCDEALYERAVRNLEAHFVALLVTEDMARSVSVLGGIVGRDLPSVGRENVNPRRPPLEDLEPATLARL